MFGYTNPYQQRHNQRPSFEERIKRFFKDYTLLAFLMIVTIVGYIVVKAPFFYALFFVFMLYFGGLFYCQFYRKLHLLWVWLSGIASGYLFFWLMQFTGTPETPTLQHIATTIGAGAVAVATVLMTSMPDMKMRVLLISSIKTKYIIIALLIIDILIKDIDDGGTHLAHIGGMISGFLYGFFTAPHFKENVFVPLRQKFSFRKNSRRQKFTTIRNEEERPLTDEKYNEVRAEKQKKIDEILDKISKSGYDSLTKEEKELLFSQSHE